MNCGNDLTDISDLSNVCKITETKHKPVEKDRPKGRGTTLFGGAVRYGGPGRRSYTASHRMSGPVLGPALNCHQSRLGGRRTKDNDSAKLLAQSFAYYQVPGSYERPRAPSLLGPEKEGPFSTWFDRPTAGPTGIHQRTQVHGRCGYAAA